MASPGKPLPRAYIAWHAARDFWLGVRGLPPADTHVLPRVLEGAPIIDVWQATETGHDCLTATPEASALFYQAYEELLPEILTRAVELAEARMKER